MTDPANHTDRLIDRLTEELEPVRPLPRLRTAFAFVLAVWAAILAVGLLGSSTGWVWSTLQSNWIYGASFVGLVVAALGGTASVLAAGVPGRERVEQAGMFLAFAGLTAAAVVCWMAIPDVGANHSYPGVDGMCFQDAVWSSLLPAGVIFTFLVRGWVSRPIVASLVGLLASAGVGALLVHLSCSLITPKHILVGHLSVPFVLGVLGMYPLGWLIRRLRG